MWRCLGLTQKGNTVAPIIEKEDITVLNNGEPTHYHIQTGTLSCIDLSISSSNCAMEFDWKTSNDWHISDHAPIIIDTQNSPPAQKSLGSA